jgi:hypothetical protein
MRKSSLILLLAMAFVLTTVVTGFSSTVIDGPCKELCAKCWDYDISHNKIITNGINITTPIGGKSISITLLKSYNFQWEEHNNFYFLELEGH